MNLKTSASTPTTPEADSLRLQVKLGALQAFLSLANTDCNDFHGSTPATRDAYIRGCHDLAADCLALAEGLHNAWGQV